MIVIFSYVTFSDDLYSKTFSSTEEADTFIVEEKEGIREGHKITIPDGTDVKVEYFC